MEEIKKRKPRKPRGRQQMSTERAKAYKYFMETEMSQKQIAEAVGVSEHSIAIWKAEGDWEAIKIDLEIGSTNIRRTAAEQYRLIKIGSKPTVDLKALEQIMDIMLRLESSVNIKNASAIFSAFNKYLVYEQQVDSDILVMLTNFQQSFIEYLIQNPIR